MWFTPQSYHILNHHYIIGLFCISCLGFAVAPLRFIHCVACWSIVFIGFTTKARRLYISVVVWSLVISHFSIVERNSSANWIRNVCVCVNSRSKCLYFEPLLFSSGSTALSTLKSEHVAMETDAPDSITSPRSVRYTSDPLMHFCLVFLFDLYCNSHWICVSDDCSVEHLPEPTEHSSVCGWHK